MTRVYQDHYAAHAAQWDETSGEWIILASFSNEHFGNFRAYLMAQKFLKDLEQTNETP